MAMIKLKMKIANTSRRNIIDYSLLAGFVIAMGGAVVPGFMGGITPMFSKLGSMMIDATFFLFFNA
jgi:hypothetical protein